MPNELPERLSTILADVRQTIANAESGVGMSSRQLGALLDELEQERSRVQGEIEHITLDRLVKSAPEDEQSSAHAEEEAELRALQHELTNSLGRVSSLHQGVIDFEHLMAAARHQFALEERLPGVEEAQELTQRQAKIRAKEEERKRLSREIHDGPAQVLANAIIGLEFIERSLRQSEATAEAPAVHEVERIKASMRDGLSEIRRFIFDLRPTMLTQRGLIGTVEHYISTYRTFLPEEINVELPPNPPSLTPDQELTAFRVIQESLQNIHRHSHATRCSISIQHNDETVLINVRDNGRGFDPAAVKVQTRGGSGIIGMRERAEVIGATLDVDTSLGDGCRVCLVIPMAVQPSEGSLEDAVDQRRAR
ncbi:MAG: sensor histidine kinase [Thermomicrobiaceae bacterium]